MPDVQDVVAKSLDLQDLCTMIRAPTRRRSVAPRRGMNVAGIRPGNEKPAAGAPPRSGSSAIFPHPLRRPATSRGLGGAVGLNY